MWWVEFFLCCCTTEVSKLLHTCVRAFNWRFQNSNTHVSGHLIEGFKTPAQTCQGIQLKNSLFHTCVRVFDWRTQNFCTHLSGYSSTELKTSARRCAGSASAEDYTVWVCWVPTRPIHTPAGWVGSVRVCLVVGVCGCAWVCVGVGGNGSGSVEGVGVRVHVWEWVWVGVDWECGGVGVGVGVRVWEWDWECGGVGGWVGGWNTREERLTPQMGVFFKCSQSPRVLQSNLLQSNLAPNNSPCHICYSQTWHGLQSNLQQSNSQIIATCATVKRLLQSNLAPNNSPCHSRAVEFHCSKRGRLCLIGRGVNPTFQAPVCWIWPTAAPNHVIKIAFDFFL